jgi:hypothetical protein
MSIGPPAPESQSEPEREPEIERRPEHRSRPEPRGGGSLDPLVPGFAVTAFAYDGRPRLVEMRTAGERGCGAVYRREPPAPYRLESHHPPDGRLHARTAEGDTEHWRDNPTRYLLAEPDGESEKGMMKPVLKHGRPVYPWLCREEREARSAAWNPAVHIQPATNLANLTNRRDLRGVCPAGLPWSPRPQPAAICPCTILGGRASARDTSGARARPGSDGASHSRNHGRPFGREFGLHS